MCQNSSEINSAAKEIDGGESFSDGFFTGVLRSLLVTINILMLGNSP
jgi:hypothetical protein